MYTAREILAIVLAAGLGLALVLKPQAVLRLQFFAYDPSGRHGEWGEDSVREFPDWVPLLLRGVGLVVLGIGAAILAMPHV